MMKTLLLLEVSKSSNKKTFYNEKHVCMRKHKWTGALGLWVIRTVLEALYGLWTTLCPLGEYMKRNIGGLNSTVVCLLTVPMNVHVPMLRQPEELFGNEISLHASVSLSLYSLFRHHTSQCPESGKMAAPSPAPSAVTLLTVLVSKSPGKLG